MRMNGDNPECIFNICLAQKTTWTSILNQLDGLINCSIFNTGMISGNAVVNKETVRKRQMMD